MQVNGVLGRRYGGGLSLNVQPGLSLVSMEWERRVGKEFFGFRWG